MPTTITHGLAGLAVGALVAPEPMPWPYHVLTLGLAMLPDLDVVSFYFGIPYGARLGHRGLSHSLFVALLISLLVALAASGLFAVSWWLLWLCFFAAMASHTLLDAMTDGGLGVALFSPLDDRRYFLPFRPIRVSPIGLAALGRWGRPALRSEVLWVWLPLGLAVTFRFLLRWAL